MRPFLFHLAVRALHFGHIDRSANDSASPDKAPPCRAPARDLQHIGLHVDDLDLTVPFAQEEVRQAVGLEPNGAVDEPVPISVGGESLQSFANVVASSPRS